MSRGASLALWCLLIAVALATPPLLTRVLWPALSPRAGRDLAVRQGVRGLLEGQYEVARDRLEPVAGEDSPGLLLALGLAHEKLGDPHQALALYRRYRSLAPDVAPGPFQVDERIAALQAGSPPPPFLSWPEALELPVPTRR